MQAQRSPNQKIKLDNDERFKNGLTSYKSLKYVDYIYKRDLLPTLYQLAMRTLPTKESPLAENTLILYLRKMEAKLEDHSEMIQFPMEMVQQAFEVLPQMNGKMFDLTKDECKKQVVTEAILFNTWKEMLEDRGADITNQEFEDITKTTFETLPVEENKKIYMNICGAIQYVLSRLYLFYAEFFLPKNPDNTFKPVIRLFSNKNTHLVMANEVLENLKKQKIDVSSLEEEASKMSPYATWSFRELAGKVDIKNIEFVRIPLDRFDSQYLIPTSDGGYITASRILGKPEEPVLEESDTRTLSAISVETNQQTGTTDHDDAPPIEEPLSGPTSSFEDATASNTMEPECDSSLDSTTTATEPSIIHKKQKKTKKSKKPNTPKEVQLESNSCPKCIRSSEYSRATNEKLRISKVENKHLKKNLAAVEMENIEQKEIIEMLKKKLQEKEEELQKKNTVIDVLEAEKEVMQQENQENKERIKVLEEKLRTVKPTTSTIFTQTMEQPAMVIDLSENAKDGLYVLLNVRNTLKIENPIQKIEEVADQVFEKSHDKQTQLTAKYEVKLFERKASFFMNAVESHIKWILSQSDLPSNWDPCLPEFPGYSQKFQTAYKTILKSDPPKICETLLKAPLEELEDTECVICSDDMDSFEGTLRCEECKRRYHDGCIRKWLKVKSTCPMCNESMLHEEEYPTLS